MSIGKVVFRVAFIAGIIFVFSNMGYASLSSIESPKNQLSFYSGIWEANTGSVLSIRVSDGFLDVTGKDKYSSFVAVCRVNSGTGNAKCVGEGVNYGNNQRFIYTSDMVVDGANVNLIEEWNVQFLEGESGGDTTYSRPEKR